MNHMSFSRRRFLAVAAGLAAFSSPVAAAQPWRARFLKGGFDGTAHLGGLHLTLDKGWKTYWRVPGAGGVPPSIEAVGANLKDFGFECPLPTRFADAEGETIGYKNEVIFPFRAVPAESTGPLELRLMAFLGVCEIVCIPVKIDGELMFYPESSASPDALLLGHWASRVPQTTQTGPVAAAREERTTGATFLVLNLTAPVTDIFVEGGDNLYFGAPAIASNGASVRLSISGLHPPNSLVGKRLRVTVDMDGMGLEQMVTVV